MKTERKHQLETNDLADSLGTWVEDVKPHLAQIGIGVGVVVVLIAAYVIYAQQQAASESKAWLAYLQTVNGNTEPKPDALTSVMENHSSTMAAVWANIQLADNKFNAGTEAYFGEGSSESPDVATAKKDLEEAKGLYEKVLQSSAARSSKLIKERAILGLAKSYESVNELESAKKEYEKLVQEDGYYKLLAERHLENLELQTTKNFYAQLEQYKPLISPDPKGPGTPGERPPIDFNFPGLDPTTPDPTDSSTPKDPTTESGPDLTPKTTPDPKATEETTPNAPETKDAPKPEEKTSTEKTPVEKSSVEKSVETPAKEAPATEESKPETDSKSDADPKKESKE